MPIVTDFTVGTLAIVGLVLAHGLCFQFRLPTLNLISALVEESNPPFLLSATEPANIVTHVI